MYTSGKINYKKDIQQFLSDYKQKLYELFAERNDENELLTKRGLPPYILREVLECSPLSTFIPEEYNGRGGIVSEEIGRASCRERSSSRGGGVGEGCGLSVIGMQKVSRHWGVM